MALGKQDAKFCILYVAVSSVLTQVPGQTNTTFGGSSTIADTTNKDSVWVTGLATKISGNISCEVNVMESTSLVAIETAWIGAVSINCKVVLDETGAMYYGAFHVASFQYDGADADATKVSIELVPTDALATST